MKKTAIKPTESVRFMLFFNWKPTIAVTDQIRILEELKKAGEKHGAKVSDRYYCPAFGSNHRRMIEMELPEYGTFDLMLTENILEELYHSIEDNRYGMLMRSISIETLKEFEQAVRARG